MTIQFTPSLDGPAYATQAQHWKQDERPQQYAAIAICTAAPTIAVAVRLWAQRTYRKSWGLDDLFIIVALLIVYAEVVASCLALKAGAGLHQVRVLKEDQDPPNGLSYIYINYWIVSVLWAPGVMFIKLSILILYRRLFLVQQKWFKIALWVNAFYAAGLGISSTFVFIFQCAPVDWYWTRYRAYYGIEMTQGTCLPQLAHLAAPQFLNTVSDMAILLLPVPVIWNLKIQNARKVAVSGVFLLGCFTVGCGIARIAVIFRVSNETDVTWNNIDTVTFTVVEAGVGIVCACLPPSAPLYSYLMKKWGLMAGGSDPKVHYYGETTNHPPKTLSDLVRESDYHAWSPTGNNRNSGVKLKRPQDAILVENRIETSSDIGEDVKQPFRF
ncbi:hypothetical protein N7470_007127 [Penicillium chermesinum]|nr:hypothetical protein N7470_007127 [Penicillium chermesinum]